MTTDTNSKDIKPSGEDKQRLDILLKEINERLDEFSSIIFKTLTKRTDNTLSKVSFERSEKGNNVEAVAVVKDPDNFDVGYYCDPPGICKSDPC